MEFKNYFQSYNNYFWEWDDWGEVLAIPNESTIAYRGFIVEVLEKLADEGLPPFGALLLAIAATNPGGSMSLDCIYSILKDRVNDNLDNVLADAIAFLKILTKLPVQYKTGKKRILLLQAIFARCHNILSVKASVNLYETFLTIKNNQENPGDKSDFNEYIFLKDFRTIALIAKKFHDVDSIIERIAALPPIPEDVPLTEDTEPKVDTEKDFIDALTEHYKTFHIGSLIKHIWGGLNIPVHSSVPSQQPVGGVSDLTNRGEFDKLLISEFANDDLVFLSRLANNEALYIRREVPPAQNNLSRIILIDVSLKNWGTPKTVAFAVMLAIARHPKTNIPCSAFAVGDTFYPLSIDSIHGIIEGLQVLHGSLHCGQGLAAFFKTNPANSNQEVILITERTTVKQADMLLAITNHSNISYTIYTDAGGNIDIYRKLQNSKKHLQHLQIPLDNLWKKAGAKAAKQFDPTSSFPILFRNSVKGNKIMTTTDGAVFQVTRDNVLLKLYDKSGGNNKGWELLLQNIPFATSDFEIGLMKSGDYMFLVFDRNNKTVVLINLTNGAKTEYPFPDWQPTSKLSFVFDNDCFYNKHLSEIWAISEKGGIARTNDVPGRILFERSKALNAIANRYSSTATVLKNIHHLFINQVGNLVFNVHELVLKENHHLKLEKTGFLQKECDSIKEGENQFVFSDGSAVETNRAGVFILKSSDPAIPHIYISSVISATTGAATEEEFAGNEYYNKSLRIITAREFCRKYINAFIHHIQTATKKS